MRNQLFLRPSGQSYESSFINRGFLPKLFLSGFVATLAMTVLVYVGPLLGLPNVDFAGLLGSFLTMHPVSLFSTGWWLGLAWHFINGSLLFPAVYAYWVYPVFNTDRANVSIRDGFRNQSVSRGMLWGVILWAFCQALAMPFAGAGFFSTHTLQPVMVLVGSLIAHLIYGSVLGAVAASRSGRRILLIRHERDHERAA